MQNMKSKQVKGYISHELKTKLDNKIMKQYGEKRHVTDVIRKLLIKYVDGEIKLK